MISSALERFWLKNLLGLIPYRYRTPGGKVILCRRRYELNMCHSLFEKGFYRLAGLPGPIEIVVDAGANIGVFSAFCLEQFNLTRIVAVEPFAVNFRRINQMAAANGWSSILSAEHAALGDRCGSAAFYMPEVAHHSFTLKADAAKPGVKRATVPLMTLDHLIKRHSLRRIDLLKLDIEGSEMEVLRASAESLRGTKIIIVETHAPHSSYESIQSILGPLGFIPCPERHRADPKNSDYYFVNHDCRAD